MIDADADYLKAIPEILGEAKCNRIHTDPVAVRLQNSQSDTRPTYPNGSITKCDLSSHDVLKHLENRLVDDAVLVSLAGTTLLTLEIPPVGQVGEHASDRPPVNVDASFLELRPQVTAGGSTANERARDGEGFLAKFLDPGIRLLRVVVVVDEPVGTGTGLGE